MPALTKNVGETILAHDTITNTGNVVIGNCSAAIYINPTSPPTAGQGWVGPRHTYGVLNPGASITIARGDVGLTIVSSITPGTYYIYLSVRDESVSPAWEYIFNTGYTVTIPSAKAVTITGLVVE